MDYIKWLNKRLLAYKLDKIAPPLHSSGQALEAAVKSAIYNLQFNSLLNK